MPTKVLVIYHGNCADGFASAWVVRQACMEGLFLQDVLRRDINTEYYPGVYQEEPPYDKCKGARVIFVDFSYKRHKMLQIAEYADSLTIIDHHKSAIDDLAGLKKDIVSSSLRHYDELFDIMHCGAMLTWQYFFHDQEPPQLLKHVEDRDLWRFRLPKTREIQAALFSYPYDFTIWSKLMLHKESLVDLIHDGEAIERKHFKDIHELLEVNTMYGTIGGMRVPIANLPYTMSSDAGHIMCEKHPDAAFAACYSRVKDGTYVFSLRSTDHGADVSEVAKKYGGGGHRNAAGFKSIVWAFD